MKENGSKSAAQPGGTNGQHLIRKMALEALTVCHRDRQAARRLFKHWLAENDELLEAVSGPSINIAIGYAIRHDIGVERQDVVRLARAAPRASNGVPVGGSVLPEKKGGCLPVPSDAAVARAAAHVKHYSGLLGFPLPVTGKLMGEARAWEILDMRTFYTDRRKAEGIREHFAAFIWLALPDRNKPASKQKPVSHWLDADAIQVLDTRAQVAAASKTLQLPDGGK